MGSLDKLKDKSTVVILTYAPTGLGHLRVTNSLYHGLPKEITPVLLGADDTATGFIHRIGSIHPVLRTIGEWMQRSWPEDIYTSLYRYHLENSTKTIRKKIEDIFHERIEVPKTLLIVATHFGLAHQLAAVKNKLEKKLKVRIFLALQVTDDSPQHIWFVRGADVIFIPSYTTKEKLIEYGKKYNMPAVKLEINSYPIDPILGKKLNGPDFENRKKQLDAQDDEKINMAMPVSGAAVGTDYMEKLIFELNLRSPRFQFHVISKEAPYTVRFLSKMQNLPFVSLHISSHDRGVVEQYDEVYMKNIISLEVTKPSEQSFKVLFTPKQHGGSLLLFSTPVGRQEYDNIDFMRRHGLLPSKNQMRRMWENAGDTTVDDTKTSDIGNIRGLELPKDPKNSAEFIFWCLKKGIFQKMLGFDESLIRDRHKKEVNSQGVAKFWQKLNDWI